MLHTVVHHIYSTYASTVQTQMRHNLPQDAVFYGRRNTERVCIFFLSSLLFRSSSVTAYLATKIFPGNYFLLGSFFVPWRGRAEEVVA